MRYNPLLVFPPDTTSRFRFVVPLDIDMFYSYVPPPPNVGAVPYRIVWLPVLILRLYTHLSFALSLFEVVTRRSCIKEWGWSVSWIPKSSPRRTQRQIYKPFVFFTCLLVRFAPDVLHLTIYDDRRLQNWRCGAHQPQCRTKWLPVLTHVPAAGKKGPRANNCSCECSSQRNRRNGLLLVITLVYQARSCDYCLLGTSFRVLTSRRSAHSV